MTEPSPTPTGHDTEYDTAGPARIDVDLTYGSVRVIAAERSTTRVVVRAASAACHADGEAAGAVRVDYLGGVVSVALPRRRLSSLLRPGAVDVLIEAPIGSSMRASTSYAHLAAEGRFGQCDVRSSYGDIRLDVVDEGEIKTSGGHVVVGVVERAVTVSSSYAPIRIGEVHGRCELRNSSGDVLVGTVRDALRIQSTYGKVAVENAVSGSLEVLTSYGAVDLGIAAGTAVRLDVLTKNGHVSTTLTPSTAPRDVTTALDLRVRSGWGDVSIRRALRHEGDPR